MSRAPVDVLAVLQVASDACDAVANRPRIAEDVREARAAVAELIVAAKWVQRRAKDYDMPTDGLDAALARIGGGA